MRIPLNPEAKKLFQEKVASGESRIRITESQPSTKVAESQQDETAGNRKSTDAHIRAAKRWNEKQAQISIRVKPELKAQISEYAASRGESLAALIVRSVQEQMKRDSADLDRLLDS